MKQHYIQAVLESLREGKNPAEVLEGLQTTLEHRNHTRLLPSILHGVEKQLSSSRGGDAATVVVANENVAKSEIEAALSAVDAPIESTVVVDESIIGGVIARYKTMMIDNSYKTKLVSLYRNTKR